VVDAAWNIPGADPADFFNYGLNQRSWKEYCSKVKKFQLEFTMQKKIEVYDRDGRTRGSNSELPPELAAAVAEQRHASFGPPAGTSLRKVELYCETKQRKDLTGRLKLTTAKST
jgi:hypothetical protein